MTRLQRLRTWLDEKSGYPPDEFDLKTTEILRSPTATACLIAGLPTKLVLLVIGCQTKARLLFWMRSQVPEGDVNRPRLEQAGWAIHGGGISAGLYHRFTM